MLGYFESFPHVVIRQAQFSVFWLMLDPFLCLLDVQHGDSKSGRPSGRRWQQSCNTSNKVIIIETHIDTIYFN